MKTICLLIFIPITLMSCWTDTDYKKTVSPGDKERRTFVGTAMVSDDKPLFIWDFADSESFYLDGLKSWDNKYLNKKITVEGVLIQNSVGESVIKDWEIIDNRTEEIQQKDDFNKIVKQIDNSLPNGWAIRMDTIQDNKFIIHSSVIDLKANPLSNDPSYLKGQCEIYILIVPRISPDSINTIRERIGELREHLPPQNSKDNLKNWYKENEKTLKIIDSEPIHYDDNYSYRIECSRLPKNEKDKNEYNKIMDYINQIFKQYNRIIRHSYLEPKK